MFETQVVEKSQDTFNPALVWWEIFTALLWWGM